MGHTVFTQSSIHGHLGHFHLVAPVNNAAMNVVYKCLFKSPLSVLWGMHPETELQGHRALLFGVFLRSRHIVFHNGGTGFHSHHRCSPVHFLHVPATTYYFPCFGVVAVLVGMKRPVTVV